MATVEAAARVALIPSLFSLSLRSGERAGVRGAFSMSSTKPRSSRVPALAGVSRDQHQPHPLSF